MKARRNQVAIAMVVSVLLMLVSFGVAAAAPSVQAAQPVRMSFGLALVIGILYYLSNSPWLANLGFTVFYRPLVAGTLVGIVLGHPAEGIAIGANINVLYLGWISAGGSLPGDPALAGYLGTALVIAGGLDIKAALALAAPLGLLGGLTWSLRMSLCSIIPHWADAAALKGDVKGVARANYIYSQPFLFVLYGIPVALAAWLGSAAVGAGLDWVGANASWVMSGLYAASGMLAALGIALNLKFLLRGNVWPYFFIGFMITSMMTGTVNLLVLAIIGAAVAYIHVLFTEGVGTPGGAPLKPIRGASVATAPAGGMLTKGDVFASWWRWLLFSHSCYNWERMQGMGFAHSMTPIIAKLYKTKEDITAALQRHLVFFNTQPDIGGIILGATIAMEEERACGAEISDDAINAVKTGLMGPMAGIGDTIQQGVVIPIALAIGMSLATGGQLGTATTGNIIGPLFFLIICAAFVWGVGWWLFYQGYAQGRSAVTNILKSGTLNKVITGAQVLGNFIMGALVVSFVKVQTGLAFMIGGTKFDLQGIFNQFMPNLLPLMLVLLVWWLVAKKKVSPTTVMVAIILVGVLTAFPIWPGLTDKGVYQAVGLFK